MDARHSADYKWYEVREPSLFWRALSAIGWGIAWGMIAGFVILTFHFGR